MYVKIRLLYFNHFAATWQYQLKSISELNRTEPLAYRFENHRS